MKNILRITLATVGSFALFSLSSCSCGCGKKKMESETTAVGDSIPTAVKTTSAVKAEKKATISTASTVSQGTPVL